MQAVRSIARALGAGAIALLVGACAGSAGAPSFTYAPPAAPTTVPIQQAPAATPAARSTANAALAVSQPNAPAVTRLDLTVVTGDMIGHTEYPAFVPSDFSLPAYATVVVTVTNFDDATALPKGSEQYAKVTGTDGGTLTATPIKVGNPNTAAGPTRTLAAIDPAAVSHTFTIPTLGINVPIPAHSRVTFTIHTGAPGTFAWRCYDPCGADPMGWGTAMGAKRGFMEGTLTVA